MNNTQTTTMKGIFLQVIWPYHGKRERERKMQWGFTHKCVNNWDKEEEYIEKSRGDEEEHQLEDKEELQSEWGHD